MTAGDYTVNPQSAFGEVSSETLAGDKSAGLTYYKSENKIWKIIGILSLVTAFIAVALGSYAFATTYPLTQAGAVSCQHATGGTGVYYIKTDPKFNSYPVYCDMDTDGGGWTLVAAVHENDIAGKCTNGDKWSNDQGFRLSDNYNGTMNWENTNIFGNIYSLSDDDYKNMAYYNLQASNVMVWHVPNTTPLREFSSKAFLKYFTNNDFLKQYGGTLRSLYKDYAPMTHSGPGRFFSLIAPPVVYAKGNDSVVMSRIPHSQKLFVQPGFLQFRAFDLRGFPNALCPGAKIVQGNSAQVCVGGGGVSTRTVAGFRQIISRTDCGDFAGWGGFSNDPASQSMPSNSSHSLDDISTSLFIFVR